MNQPLQPRSLQNKRRPRNLGEEVVSHLKQEIESGALKAGDKLPTESELMLLYGVSRTVVREALSRLQAEDIIETRHGIGSFVRALEDSRTFRIDPRELTTIQDILDVLQLRQSLESAAAGIAAQRRTPEQLQDMWQTLIDFEQALAQGRDTADADFRFHLSIAQATGNRYFVEFMSYLGRTVIPRTRINTAQLGAETQQHYLERVHEEHKDILRAIESQNPLVASSAMQMHLNNSANRLRSTLKLKQTAPKQPEQG